MLAGFRHVILLDRQLATLWATLYFLLLNRRHFVTHTCAVNLSVKVLSHFQVSTARLLSGICIATSFLPLGLLGIIFWFTRSNK